MIINWYNFEGDNGVIHAAPNSYMRLFCGLYLKHPWNKVSDAPDSTKCSACVVEMNRQLSVEHSVQAEKWMELLKTSQVGTRFKFTHHCFRDGVVELTGHGKDKTPIIQHLINGRLEAHKLAQTIDKLRELKSLERI